MSGLSPAPRLHLYQSNRLENLFDALCQLTASPLADPLVPEIIVVQNPGMARWLAQNIAETTGIAANLAFPLPASFFWGIFQKTLGDLPDLSRFEQKILLWRIMAELDALLALPSMTEIAGYLDDDPDGIKRFQLVEKITDTFDQYQVYRPEMLLNWEKGREDHWQAILWNRLTSDNHSHRAALLKQLFAGAKNRTLTTSDLPQRVAFFGINSLAPAYLEIINILQSWIEIHIFHLSPCAQAWDDILPERLLALKRQEWRKNKSDDLSNYFTSGNPLLASMGAMGQEFFSLLMELHPQEHDLYQPPEATTLLGNIQQDILNLQDSTAGEAKVLLQDDQSISFHCCHSPMREVQILHDRLLDLFAADHRLKPADILVMAPDINEYAPFINGIFGAARDNLHLPWSIADRRPRAEQSVLTGFTALLEAITGRFTAPEITAFFDIPAICRRYDLSTTDLPAMRRFIKKAGIRWGLNSQQRNQHLEMVSELHTWQYGLDRLLMGYITGQIDEFCLDILPCASDHTGAASWLGSLAEFITRLTKLYTLSQNAQPPAEWAALLKTLLDDFFDPGSDSADQDGISLLREQISSFAENCKHADFTGKLRLGVIRHHFNALLAEPAGGQAFLGGKVTFCNMVPMRSIPFKVIWLLGMNDTAYPRTSRAPSFDHIAKKPMLGDRSRRDDDRYLFLESLLSARNHLKISWLGRDLQTNAVQPPSVVVAELRDYIDRGWQSDRKTAHTSDILTTEHPLQPFSSRCFNNTAATQSYAGLWLPETDSSPENSFLKQPLPLPAAETETINISQLLRFWQHPVQFFLETRLQLFLHTTDNIIPESEAFTLDHLQSYLINQDIVNQSLTEDKAASRFARMTAEGDFPVGSPGELYKEKLFSQTRELRTTLDSLMRKPIEPTPVDLQVDGIHLTGSMDLLFAEGFVSYRPAQCKGRDLFRLWLNHLLLNLVQPSGAALFSYHAGLDSCVRLDPVENPAQELALLLHNYIAGQQRPLHFYANTAYAWAKAKKPDRMKKARNSWYNRYNYYSNGEEDHPAYTIALRGHDPLDKEFTELAALFFPLIAHLEDKNCVPA